MKYDCAVIGAGPGGYVAALRAGQRGLATVLIEKSELGGTCLNRGCIPTKALLHISELVADIRQAQALGISTGKLEVDYGKVAAQKDLVVDQLRRGIAGLLKARKVQVISGQAKLAGTKKIVVSDEAGKSSQIEAENIIIATGTEPSKLAGFPFDGQMVMNTDDVLAMTSLPKSLLIVGGGIAGCEFTTMFAEFGLEVTVVELMDSLLPGLDADVGKYMALVFKQKKIAVHTSSKIVQMSKSGQGIEAKLEDGQELRAERALVAIGRTTNLSQLGLEEAGVQNDGRFIKVDQSCRTNLPGIWAIGEVSGALPLAHVASRMGVVAVENIAGTELQEDLSVVPVGVFTHPEIGYVGLSEAEAAKKAGKMKIKVGKFSLEASGIARAYRQTSGFVKIIADEGSGEVLGAWMVGGHAADVIQQVALAMKSECTVQEIVQTIHTHPTFSEALAEAGEAWLGQGLHSIG